MIAIQAEPNPWQRNALIAGTHWTPRCELPATCFGGCAFGAEQHEATLETTSGVTAASHARSALAEQQDRFDFAEAGSLWRLPCDEQQFFSAAASTTYEGGSTPLSRAQASFSSIEKQQHDRQHCSAERQPQWCDWHGKGPVAGKAGIGKPNAAAKYTTSDNQPTKRRRRGVGVMVNGRANTADYRCGGDQKSQQGREDAHQVEIA